MAKFIVNVPEGNLNRKYSVNQFLVEFAETSPGEDRKRIFRFIEPVVILVPGDREAKLPAGWRLFEDDDFASGTFDLKRYLWAPALGMYGIQRIHRLPDVMVLAGAGVGGGSLNYANTLYVPPESFFRDAQWSDITDWQAELEPHYATASTMLGVVTNPCEGPVEQIMRQAAHDLGVGATYRKTPVGVFFGGVLSQGPGWRWVMFVNLPVCALVLVGAFRLISGARRRARLANFDTRVAILATGGTNSATTDITTAAVVEYR